MKKFHYQNTEKHAHNGKHEIRKVYVKGGKGYKSVTRKYRGKNRTIKRTLKSHEINKICRRKFIPGLFDNCK
jgi:hypothetical protein